MRLYLVQDTAFGLFASALDGGPEPDILLVKAALDDFVQSVEGPAANEQDVFRVHLYKLLVGVLAPALRRDIGDSPLHEFQERLLHALAGHVARNGHVFALARDFVDFVDVDDAALGALDVEVGGL